MKQKTEKDFVAWLNKTVEYYRPHIDIGSQKIRIELKENAEYMSILVTYPYLEPVLYYSKKAFEDWKKNKLPKHTVLHELIHTLTDPLYSKAVRRYVGKDEIEDERERLTDRLCIILDKLIE